MVEYVLTQSHEFLFIRELRIVLLQLIVLHKIVRQEVEDPLLTPRQIPLLQLQHHQHRQIFFVSVPDIEIFRTSETKTIVNARVPCDYHCLEPHLPCLFECMPDQKRSDSFFLVIRMHTYGAKSDGGNLYPVVIDYFCTRVEDMGYNLVILDNNK